MQKKVNLAILHCIKNKVLMQSARNPKYIFKKKEKKKKKTEHKPVLCNVEIASFFTNV